MRKVRARVRFKGRVQGVGFRHFTTLHAGSNELTGWVRNLGNGDVEAVFEGRESAIRRALEGCRQGPPGGGVTELLIDWEECRNEFDGFEIRY
jgi:acylphosphatase